jgi:hypothetical protein
MVELSSNYRDFSLEAIGYTNRNKVSPIASMLRQYDKQIGIKVSPIASMLRQ